MTDLMTGKEFAKMTTGAYNIKDAKDAFVKMAATALYINNASDVKMYKSDYEAALMNLTAFACNAFVNSDFTMSELRDAYSACERYIINCTDHTEKGATILEFASTFLEIATA